jgi:hypothetical protein
MPDRSRRAKRADRARGGDDQFRAASGATPPPDERDLDPEVETTLDDERAEEAELDAAADELRESGVAQKIAAGDREAVLASQPVAPPVKSDRSRTTVAGAPAPAVARRTDTLPYVDDRVSKVWVALIAIVFAAVFAYAFLGGKAGLLTKTPSPSPTPSATPTASPSPTVSPSPGATTPGVSPTP